MKTYRDTLTFEQINIRIAANAESLIFYMRLFDRSPKDKHLRAKRDLYAELIEADKATILRMIDATLRRTAKLFAE